MKILITSLISKLSKLHDKIYGAGSKWVLVSPLPDSSLYFIIGENPNSNPNTFKEGFPVKFGVSSDRHPWIQVVLPCLVQAHDSYEVGVCC